MLLTGQRCGEVVGMRRSEISGHVWTLLPERTKNKQRHEVPLSKQALAIIDAIPGVDEDYLFTSSPTRRLGNMAPVKVALDAHMKPKEPMGDPRLEAHGGIWHGAARRPAPGDREGIRAFRQGLKDAGHIEGENVTIEYRWGENQIDRVPALVTELIRRQV